jgi:hypothetical protein
MKVSMTERLIGVAFTLVGSVLIGAAAYVFLKLILSVLLALHGRR